MFEFKTSIHPIPLNQLLLYYLIIFSLYTSIVWIFDTLLLQKIEMMAFALFLSFATCLKKTETSYI